MVADQARRQVTPGQRGQLAAAARDAAQLAEQQRQAARTLAEAIEDSHTTEGIAYLLDTRLGVGTEIRQWAGQLLASMLAAT